MATAIPALYTEVEDAALDHDPGVVWNTNSVSRSDEEPPTPIGDTVGQR